MQKSKIFINTTFDMNVLKLIIKRNWYWCVLIFALLNSLAFIYLRYTKPVYEAKILIQINSENQSSDILGFQDIIQDNSLSKDIEIIRSRRLFNNAIKQLPLEVIFYNKGEFLTENKYGRSNASIQVVALKDSSLINKPIELGLRDKTVTFNFEHKGTEYQYEILPNQLVKTPFFDLVLQVNNEGQLKSEISSSNIFFKFSNVENLARDLYSGITVETVDHGARTVQIKSRNENPALAKDVVSSLTYNFFRYDEELKKESAQNILEFIDVQLDSLTSELVVSKDSVLNFKRKENIADRESIISGIQNRIETLRLEEEKVLEDDRILKNVQTKINDNPNSLEVYKLVPDMVGQTHVGSLTGQIDDLYRLIEQREELSFKVTGDNEKMKRLNDQIALRSEMINNLINFISERNNDKLKIIRESIQEVEGQYSLLPEKQMELDRLVSIQNLNEKYYSLLTEKKVVYSISNAGYSSDNKILNDATVTASPVFPIPGIIYGVSIFLSVVFSVGFLVLRYTTFNEINDVSDLHYFIPENVGMLGVIPLVKERMENSLLSVDKRPKSALSESFRNIRANLSFINKDFNTIAITSTTSGEGKTYAVLNLAGIISMTGKRVIVIDMDLRKPKIHHGFNTSNDYGLSNLLAGHYTLDEVIQKSRLENLDYITAGAIPPNPSELVLGDAFKKLFEDLKERYDVILYDTPPVGIVSDGIRLLTKVDIPIYVFRANYSKRYFTQKLQEVAEIKDITNLNIILNGVSITSNTYVDKHGGGYYID